VGRRTAGQSGEFVTSAGAGGASAASADTAPAADATKREPSVRAAGGGLVQDGGSLKEAIERSGVARSLKDRVIDLYAAEAPTTREMAARTGAPEGSIGGWLSAGRKAGDQRVKDGDAKRDARIAALSKKPTPRDIADSAKPADPAADAPAIPTGGVEIPAGKLIAIRGAEVCGPTGIWRTSKEIAKAFGLIADGQLYGLETMARHGGLDPKVCVGLIPMWTASLVTIGIELHHHKGYGLRIRAIGGQA